MTARGVSFVVTPCSLVGGFENCERIYSFYLQGIPVMSIVAKCMYYHEHTISDGVMAQLLAT